MLSPSGLQATVGRITGILGAPARRYVLFFEDILAESIRNAPPTEVEDAGRISMHLVTQQFALPGMRLIPLHMLLNLIGTRVWQRIGAIHQLKAAMDDELTIRLWHDPGIIGANPLTIGLFRGFLEGFSEKNVQCVFAKKEDDGSVFRFSFLDQQGVEEGKTRTQYLESNMTPHVPGVSLRDALHQHFLTKRGNRIFFRESPLVLYENTLFHLLPIPGEEMSEYAQLFFGRILEPAPLETRVRVLKNLLLACGWGIPTCRIDDSEIDLTVSYPPVGLALQDRWPYLERLVEGYLRACIPTFRLRKSVYRPPVLHLHYTSMPQYRVSG